MGTLRSSVAGTKDVTATVNGTLQIAQTAQVFVAAAPASRVQMVDGNNQRAETGSEVAVPPAVRVTNSAGDPVAGVPVTFVVTQGGGSVAGAEQTTDAQGIARVGSWTLGAEGRNVLEARAGSLTGSPVVFEATATAPPPPPPPPPAAEPHHFVFRVPPRDVREEEWFTIEVAIMDASGNVVPLNGTEVYLGLFEVGDDHPTNGRLHGDRFEDTIKASRRSDCTLTMRELPLPRPVRLSAEAPGPVWSGAVQQRVPGAIAQHAHEKGLPRGSPFFGVAVLPRRDSGVCPGSA